jgi:hypothetical protein
MDSDAYKSVQTIGNTARGTHDTRFAFASVRYQSDEPEPEPEDPVVSHATADGEKLNKTHRTSMTHDGRGSIIC